MTDTLSKEERSRVMAAVKSEDTKPEMIVRRLVHSMGFRYRLHVKDLPGKPDLVFPRYRKIIKVNGCFWHMHNCGRCRIPASRKHYWVQKLQANRERDRRQNLLLKAEEWTVKSIWECETKDREQLVNMLQKFLGQQKR